MITPKVINSSESKITKVVNKKIPTYVDKFYEIKRRINSTIINSLESYLKENYPDKDEIVLFKKGCISGCCDTIYRKNDYDFKTTIHGTYGWNLSELLVEVKIYEYVYNLEIDSCDRKLINSFNIEVDLNRFLEIDFMTII